METPEFYCPTCARPVPDPLVCGDCHAVICRTCGTPLERIDDLGIGWSGVLSSKFGDHMIRTQDSPRQDPPADEKTPWMRYAGFVESGDANSSQAIDEIVYSWKD